MGMSSVAKGFHGESREWQLSSDAFLVDLFVQASFRLASDILVVLDKD